MCVCTPQGKHAAAKKAAADSEDGDNGHMCDDACGHGHSLSSGAGGPRSNPVAAMPGLVFEPKVAKSVVAFMAADSRDKVRGEGDPGRGVEGRHSGWVGESRPVECETEGMRSCSAPARLRLRCVRGITVPFGEPHRLCLAAAPLPASPPCAGHCCP